MKMKKLKIKDVLPKRKQKIDLRARLIIFVTLEIVFCVLLAYGIDFLINTFILKDFEFPLIADLIIISILVGIFATYALSRWLLKPIKKLGLAMSQVAGGDLSVRLSTKSTSREIQDIYRNFNVMTSELAATEILQTDFVSNVSHEIKTPINAIEGYSMLLQGEDNLTPEQQEYVEKIIFNTKRLSTLTGSILLLSKLENQAASSGGKNDTTFRLDEQIRQSIVALEPIWSEKEIDFDVEMSDLEYFGNQNLFHHVWDNLISNAIKFGSHGGYVRIRLWDDKGQICFTIDDNGEGISDDAKRHIFDKFYQGDSSHKDEGSGLGLALVKKIVTLEGGQIFAENLAVGGCRFIVILPKK